MIYLHFRKSTNFIEDKKKIEVNDTITSCRQMYLDRIIFYVALSLINTQKYYKHNAVEYSSNECTRKAKKSK